MGGPPGVYREASALETLRQTATVSVIRTDRRDNIAQQLVHRRLDDDGGDSLVMFNHGWSQQRIPDVEEKCCAACSIPLNCIGFLRATRIATACTPYQGRLVDRAAVAGARQGCTSSNSRASLKPWVKVSGVDAGEDAYSKRDDGSELSVGILEDSDGLHWSLCMCLRPRMIRLSALIDATAYRLEYCSSVPTPSVR
nr:hypothetical protein CFP56_74125 [Quercus suber]